MQIYGAVFCTVETVEKLTFETSITKNKEDGKMKGVIVFLIVFAIVADIAYY